MKERIAFFDPVMSQSVVSDCDAKPASLANKSNLMNHLLSRSSSAPYETHCDLEGRIVECATDNILLTPPQSPPNERTKEKRTPENESKYSKPISQVKTNATVYPVTIKSGFNLKKTNPFSLRDEFITARRHQNMCKLKGLIIPESIGGSGDESNDTKDVKPEIDLPTIISEDTLKIKELVNVEEQQNDNSLSSGEQSEPIEVIPLKPAQINVQKYSPTFKRRPFSLPTNPKIFNSSISLDQGMIDKAKTPPVPPPKPRMSLLKSNNSSNGNKPAEQVPPIPPKRKQNYVNKVEAVVDADQVKQQAQETRETKGVEPSDVNGIECEQSIKHLSTEQDQCNINAVKHDCEHVSEPVQVSEDVTDKRDSDETVSSPSNVNYDFSEDGPIESHISSNEFVIRQKQYSMSVIVLEWKSTDYDSNDIGIRLTGGLDSVNKEVTVCLTNNDNPNCNCSCLSFVCF